jgi:hypothetical protein
MRRALDFLSSLRLTVVLLALGIVLVFIGTLAQVHEGTWKAQKLYFQSWFVVKPMIYHRTWPIIFPGGYLIGTVLVVNLLLAHFRGGNWGQRNVTQVLLHHVPLLALVFAATWISVRSPFIGMGFFLVLLALDLWISRNGPLKDTYTGKKLGINFTHIGVVMLLLGQLATDQLARESHLTFREGETRSWSESHRANELVFAKDLGTDREQVISFAEPVVAQRGELKHDNLPFTARIKEYGVNSQVRRRAPMMDTNPPPATRGDGAQLTVESLPEVNDEKRRNLPYAIVEILHKGQSLGTWLVATLFLDPQEFKVGEETWRLVFRPTREYRDYSLTLLDFTHDVYPGTTKPRDFRSRVRLEDPKTRENREVDIYMNNPLRYGGETFYQSSFDPDDPRVTTLQVVRNPSWLTPYFGCGAVGYGLTRHFLFYLVAFIVRRRSA